MELFEGVTNPKHGDLWPPLNEPPYQEKRWVYNGYSWDLYIPDTIINIDNTLYVSKSGNDVTGVRGDLTKPFLTITAARDAAESGDLVVVFPGEYNDSNLLKDGIFYFMHEGVVITGSNSVSPSHTGAIKCSITGYAEFVTSGSVVNISASQYNGLELFLQCNKIECTGTGNAVLLRLECNARIEVRDEIIGGTLGLDFRNAEMNVVVRAKNIRLHNSFNAYCFPMSFQSLPAAANIDVDIETLTEKIGTDTTGPLIMVVNNNAYIKLTVRNPVIDTRPVGEVIHLDGGFIDIDVDVETTNIPFLYVGNWHNAIRKILLKGRYVCLGSNAININTSKALTLDMRDCYIKSSNKGITSIVPNNNLTAIFRNVTIDSVEESIHSTQVVDINVERDFHYTTPPNENVTLVTDYNKFPTVSSVSVDSEFISGSTNPVESQVIQTALEGIDESKWEVDTYNKSIGYGAFYNGYAVLSAETNGGFISGFRVMNRTEWDTLIDYLISQHSINPNVIANTVKSKYQVNSPYPEFATEIHPRYDANATHYGTDQFNLSFLPTGERITTGNFVGKGGASTLLLLSSTIGEVDRVWILNNSGTFSITTGDFKSKGYGVRVIRDLLPDEVGLDDGTYLTDAVDFDGNIYKVVKVGTLAITAENLITTNYINGTSINNLEDGTAWGETINPAYSWYNNNINEEGIFFIGEELEPKDKTQRVDKQWIKGLENVETNSHAQNTDTRLAEGTDDEVTAADLRSHVDDKNNPHEVDESKWEVVEGLKEFRLPTEAEWTAESATWTTPNEAGAFASPLKLSMAGLRESGDGSFDTVGSRGYYWSSTVDDSNSRFLFFISDNMLVTISNRAYGLSVRLIKDEVYTGDVGDFVSEEVIIDGLPYNTVLNPDTNRIWLDRNLGASQVATSSTDSDAYGDLYQWGRGTDGHEKRDSGTSEILSSTDQPEHGDFIINNDDPLDWRDPQNDNLWQGVDGINNPAPPAQYLLEPINKDAKVDAEWIANLPDIPDEGIVTVIQEEPIDVNNYKEGDVWIKSSTGEKFTVYETANSEKVLIQTSTRDQQTYEQQKTLILPDDINTDYVLQAEDDDNVLLTFNSGTTLTLTIPLNSTFRIGRQVLAFQKGSGQINVIAEDGVNIRKPRNDSFSRTINSIISLIKIGDNDYILGGDIA